MGLIAGGNLAQAQISYTNVDPDEQIFLGTAEYDIDGDGSADIRIEHGGFSNPASYFWYASVQGLAFGMSFKGTFSFVDALTYGDNIGGGAGFIGSGGLLAGVYGYTLYGVPGGGGGFGDWINRSDRYIGFQFADFPSGWLDLRKDSRLPRRTCLPP